MPLEDVLRDIHSPTISWCRIYCRQSYEADVRSDTPADRQVCRWKCQVRHPQGMSGQTPQPSDNGADSQSHRRECQVRYPQGISGQISRPLWWHRQSHGENAKSGIPSLKVTWARHQSEGPGGVLQQLVTVGKWPLVNYKPFLHLV